MQNKHNLRAGPGAQLNNNRSMTYARRLLKVEITQVADLAIHTTVRQNRNDITSGDMLLVPILPNDCARQFLKDTSVFGGKQAITLHGAEDISK